MIRGMDMHHGHLRRTHRLARVHRRQSALLRLQLG